MKIPSHRVRFAMRRPTANTTAEAASRKLAPRRRATRRGPRNNPLTRGVSAKSQVCGCVGFSRPKSAKNCPPFNCRLYGRLRGLQESFLEFDLGLVVVVQQENDVREPLEVGIDCAVKRQLGVARIEAALLRIVVADLDVIEIGGAGIG